MKTMEQLINRRAYAEAKWIDDHVQKLLKPWQVKLIKLFPVRWFWNGLLKIEIRSHNTLFRPRKVEIWQNGKKKFTRTERI